MPASSGPVVAKAGAHQKSMKSRSALKLPRAGCSVPERSEKTGARQVGTRPQPRPEPTKELEVAEDAVQEEPGRGPQGAEAGVVGEDGEVGALGGDGRGGSGRSPLQRVTR